MSTAPKDENASSGLTVALNSDGMTIVRVLANPTLHTLNVMDGATGSDNGPLHALHDGNDVPTLLAVSSRTATINGIHYIQGVTPVAVYGDSSGNLLIDSV